MQYTPLSSARVASGVHTNAERVRDWLEVPLGGEISSDWLLVALSARVIRHFEGIVAIWVWWGQIDACVFVSWGLWGVWIDSGGSLESRVLGQGVCRSILMPNCGFGPIFGVSRGQKVVWDGSTSPNFRFRQRYLFLVFSCDAKQSSKTVIFNWSKIRKPPGSAGP